ncbi:DUF6470 family protein [Paenibacillus sambharensis]|nr:DUF6470 family protein [Paenibacillus sambharensis]
MLSIVTQDAKLGIKTTRGRYEIKSTPPVLQVETKPAVITANNKPGELIIDSSEAHNALTGGKYEEFWDRIYSQYKAVAKRNIELIVEEGNRMGDLRIKGNPIADMALDAFIEGAPDIEVYGPASSDNVSIEYIPNQLNVQVQTGGADINVKTTRPEINYHRGNVSIYMEQYPSVTITPPKIDLVI